MPSFDQTPDEPEPFGYKISWFALKTSDPAAVLEAIEAEEATPANWASGLAAAHFHGDSQKGDPWLFISPPVGGWVFAVSFSLPYPVTIDGEDDSGAKFDALFSRLMERFDEVQFFGSYRVIGFAAWARALKGKVTRIFAYAGSEGQIFANFGEQTAEEAKLGLANLTGLSSSDAMDKICAIEEEQEAEEIRLVASGLSRADARARVLQNSRDPLPHETDVTDLAGLWSLDPTELSGLGELPGLGWAARLPKHLAG
ncbi:MAG: hypothetical protein AB1508_06870 [Pseudomonadota bacterium]